MIGNAMSRGNPEVEWLLETRAVRFEAADRENSPMPREEEFEVEKVDERPRISPTTSGFWKLDFREVIGKAIVIGRINVIGKFKVIARLMSLARLSLARLLSLALLPLIRICHWQG